MRRRRSGRVALERALSKLGLMSRAEARRAIVAGRIAVGGRKVTDPFAPVEPERLALTLDGAPLVPPAFRCLMLHKPRGVVTTRADPEGRRTVFDLVPQETHLIAVGRLDWATSGLLLLTNDTRLADGLTDPSHAVPRVYLATVRGRCDEATAARLEAGLRVDGEPLAAAAVTVRKASGRETHLTVTLTEGKNREVRRLLAAVGHEVTRLKRVAFGGLTLGALAPGRWREVDLEEALRAFGGAWRPGDEAPRGEPGGPRRGPGNR